jgi:hypothetical protein
LLSRRIGTAALSRFLVTRGLWLIVLEVSMIVLMLWPLCRWYAALKVGRRDWWLSYL